MASVAQCLAKYHLFLADMGVEYPLAFMDINEWVVRIKMNDVNGYYLI